MYMKTVFTLVLFSFVFIGCKKNNSKQQNGTPKLTVLTPRCEGGTIKSVAIPFNLTTNGATVIKVELYKSPSTKISETTSNSFTDGMYTLYDQSGTCPKQSDNVTYYFTITKVDNSKISTPTFQVYF